MKRKTFGRILGVEAAACVVLGLVRSSLSGVFSAAIAFPFEQIGLMLRALSLSGGLGNAAAIAIYVVISLAPAALLLILRKKRELYWEDALLAVLSAALFGVLYLMVNPGLMPSFMGPLSGTAGGLTVGRAVLGTAVYSVLCAYLVLRVLRLFFAGGTGSLMGYMTVLLGILNVLFVYLAFGSGFAGLLDSIRTLQEGNTGNEHLLGASYFFLMLQFAVNALPYVLDVFVVFAALLLLDELRVDRYSPGSVAAADHLSRLCQKALTVTVLSAMAFNLLQILAAPKINVINTSVQIPVLSVVFVLSVVLLARFIAENKQLKDDNDLFV